MKVAEKTELYEIHEKLGAKLTEFAGYLMPLSYESVTTEHQCVREKMGLFDVSHMGRICVRGERAREFFDYLGTTLLLEKEKGSANYTVLTNEKGGAVDDCLVYIQEDNDVFTVVNASRKEEDLAFLRSYASDFKVEITPCFDESILALQGPLTETFVPQLFPKAAGMPFMHFMQLEFEGSPFYLARAGYTGSFGYEFYLPKGKGKSMWNYLFEKGTSLGLKPVGLGARDTLRLEAGFALYGHELSEEISPLESVSRWTIKKDKRKYLGRVAIETLRESENHRYQRGCVLEEKGVPREGYKVFIHEREIGIVTSGNFSPTLKKGIAIVMADTPLKEGMPLSIEIRGKKVNARVVRLPFTT